MSISTGRTKEATKKTIVRTERPPRARAGAHPFAPVRGSRSGRPVMALLDLLGHRWTLRVLWELRESTLTFRALQDACGKVSPTVLNDRLRELREAALLEAHDGSGYALTPLGHDLFRKLLPLAAFADEWARALPRPGRKPA